MERVRADHLGSINLVTGTRGFTGQEMMDGLCLVNFNARVYDPSLGRFMSADPIVGSPYDLQELNRYTYVLDNPLSLTDPSGDCVGFLVCSGLYSIFGPAEPLMEASLRAFPILGDIGIIVASYYCGPLCGAGAAAVTVDRAWATNPLARIPASPSAMAWRQLHLRSGLSVHRHRTRLRGAGPDQRL